MNTIEENPFKDNFDLVMVPQGDLPQLNILKRYLKGHNGFIAGGVFRNIFEGKPVRDVDIFFESHSDWVTAVKYYQKKKWREIYRNDRAISFQDPKRAIRIELIGTYSPLIRPNEPEIYHVGPEDTISTLFDFTITKFVLFKAGGDLLVAHHPEYFKHLYLKRLVIDNNIVRVMSTFERTYKYQRYGYSLCRESKKKLIRAIQGAERVEDWMLTASFYNGLD